jgi:hypothetical protein
MSDAPPSPPDPGGLQFDRAEPRDPQVRALACAACKRGIDGDYYTAASQSICPDCRGAILASLEGGSGFGRFAKALILGLLAAGLGAGIYYAISALTGYEFGLVAIIVGLMVGAAVKKGAEGRGGWRYQLLAMSLTYMAIVSTYVPYIIEAARQGAAAPKDQKGPVVETAPAEGAPTPAPVPDKPVSPPAKNVTAGSCLLALVFFLGIVLAAPFLAGLQNIMGLLIIGFALYEAWALNKKPRLEIAGPFRTAGSNS